mmetsp:Transcript_13582/g.30395  ORF Transcript_13582/g.30395 Transcript_13582/m.30395 type:complete len:110 (-) Transcript_13582:814-1143(-)
MTITVRGCCNRGDHCARFKARVICLVEIGSTADVASSRIKIGGSRITARAIARRCRCPPERPLPSRITVSYPCGCRIMNSCAYAIFAAFWTCSWLTCCNPQAMFSAIVP